MTTQEVDILVVGAGPVGLMCAYLGKLCGLRVTIVDVSSGPLEVGRADALNARTLQLFELAGLFDELYPLGKPCNTSSVWAKGQFISRQSRWWDELDGCFHKHFLMIGQSFVERTLDSRLKKWSNEVQRNSKVEDIQLIGEKCVTRLSDGRLVSSRYVIGADGSRSFVREHFKIPFQITRPQIVWAVIEGVVGTDFPKVPEIIVFQTETSDVAWIPREGNIDRFYVRMDTKDFDLGDAIAKINHAMRPHTLVFKEIVWFSQFSVKESVAEKFFTHDRIFLAGDACHIHSVNGGQGLNTGLADAFNLIWKLNWVINKGASTDLLHTYEAERKPVAMSVIESSGELVRSTKYSATGTHAQDYVKIVEKRAGNITGMGIRYGKQGLRGSRLFDLEVFRGTSRTRLYSLLDYTRFSLLVFSEGGLSGLDLAELGLPASNACELGISELVKIIPIFPKKCDQQYWVDQSPYHNQAILVRPDSYIESSTPLDEFRRATRLLSRCSSRYSD